MDASKAIRTVVGATFCEWCLFVVCGPCVYLLWSLVALSLVSVLLGVTATVVASISVL